MADSILTAERLREVVDYDPDTGVFIRKVRLAQRHQVGDRADFVVTGGGLKGYRRVSLFSQRYLAHRLAWLYVHGSWPKHEIDHINGNPGDNRIDNLRDVVTAVNSQNKRKARADNRSGFLGVTTHAPGIYRASLYLNGKRIHDGLYGTPEAAHAAYIEAKREFHPGCEI
jgi:hypothetical protein